MKLFRGIQTLSHPFIHPVVTIGNFDGVHQGHQRIIQQVIGDAKMRNGTAVAFTFRPHPQTALHPEGALSLLLTYDEKIEVLKNTGLDVIIEEPFSREFSIMSAEIFFKNILLDKLHTEAIIIGYDFAFGNNRQGHITTLKALCEKAGIQLTIVPPQKIKNEIVSSSRIRRHLLEGEIEIANELLGRNFVYTGVVIKGDQRGRELGYPTANMNLEAGKLVLPYGVYATRTLFQGKSFVSATHIGIRPTFQPSSVTLETHLLDQEIDLYGSTLKIEFTKKLRDEKKFVGPHKIEQLKKQIKLDIQDVKKIKN